VRAGRRIAAGAAFVALFACGATPAAAAELRAGVGRSDITPPTGFPTFGYVRDDAVGHGVHTRLFARAIVLQKGRRKLAIVTTDLNATPGGLLVEVASRLAKRGFDERNVIISASHTHNGPAGFSTFQGDNFVAPTLGDPTHFKTDANTQLYGFLIRRIALAVERADSALGPAAVGWGQTSLAGVTDNRSLEAHLADFGFDLPYGTGRIDEDPGGYLDTIDPEVDVLRVDRIAHGRRIPLGGWLDFADHGTVNPYQFDVYNADHTGVASRLFEAAVRRAGRVPRSQLVVGAYGNADAGDMTAALRGRGPAYAEQVGRREAEAMVRAWREAGRHMSAAPAFDTRWSRSCFCGRTVEDHQVADSPNVGLPFLTGSEENRGPLYDETHDNYEGRRLPVGVGPQSRKIQAIGPPIGSFPTAVPLMVVRLGDRAMVTIPGEATVEVGRRIRSAVMAAFPPSAGVKGVAIVGYANEYIHYFTTPEEYDMQHYEGGSTLFGKYSSVLIEDDLATLASELARGAPATAPVPFDPRNGVTPDMTPYGTGATTARPVTQPLTTARIERAAFSWQGGGQGLDRPLDRPFTTVEQRHQRSWRRVTDDLGLEIVWRVDDKGIYTAQWQVPVGAAPGSYRFVVSANHYRLTSRPFRVVRSRALTLADAGRRGNEEVLTVAYPPIDVLQDLTARPGRARPPLLVAPGTTVPAGAVRDRYGNVNGEAFTAQK
jgi:neutral ceramidase